MSRPSIALLEVYLILAHYHATVKLGDSGEQIWALSHKMTELAVTLGLHRDPGDRGLPEHEVAKRRWVWWNILSFERYDLPFSPARWVFLFTQSTWDDNHLLDGRAFY